MSIITTQEAAKICQEMTGIKVSAKTIGYHVTLNFRHLGQMVPKDNYGGTKMNGVREGRWRNFLAARAGSGTAKNLFSISEF